MEKGGWMPGREYGPPEEPQEYAQLWDVIEVERDRLHSCALAEERVREVHLKVTNAWGEAWCDCCSNEEGYAYDWPCPTIRALEGADVDSRR